MKKEKNEKRTSVKVDIPTWDEFQINSTKYKTTLHDVLNKVLKKYNEDPEFRSMINNLKLY